MTEIAESGPVPGPEARDKVNNNIVERAAQTAHSVIDHVAETAVPAVERLRSGANAVADTQDRWLAACRDSIRRHPMSSVGVAVAVGVVLGRLLAR